MIFYLRLDSTMNIRFNYQVRYGRRSGGGEELSNLSISAGAAQRISVIRRLRSKRGVQRNARSTSGSTLMLVIRHSGARALGPRPGMHNPDSEFAAEPGAGIE